MSAEDPEANGLAENFMKILKKSWHSSIVEGKKLKQEMYKLLRQYRATPHSSTGYAPAEVLFNRPFKTRLPNPVWPTHGSHELQKRHNELEKKHNASKTIQKYHKDQKANVRAHDIKVGDTVLLLQTPTKQRPWYDPSPYHVTQVAGTQVTATREDGKNITRDSQRFKKVQSGLHPANRYKSQRWPTNQTSEAQHEPQLGETVAQPSTQLTAATNPTGSDASSRSRTTDAAPDLPTGAPRQTSDGDVATTMADPEPRRPRTTEHRRPERTRRPPAYLRDYVP